MSTNILHHIRVAPDKKRGHEFTSRDGEAPELLLKATLEETRAQGRPGAGRTRSLVCSKKAHELVTTGSTETSGLPCAMVLTLLRALPGVHDLLVTVVRRIITYALNASPGAPGPHDFVVRDGIARRTMPPASIASRLACRDDRDPPLVPRRDGVGDTADLGF